MTKPEIPRGEQFIAEATYYNVSTNTFFFSLVGFLLTYYAWSKNGWILLTQFLLMISLLLIVLTVWLFFSKYSIRQIYLNNDVLSIGKRSFSKDNIIKVECMNAGRVFHIHVQDMDQSLTLRIKEEYHDIMKVYLNNWCNQFDIPFIEKNKNN